MAEISPITVELKLNDETISKIVAQVLREVSEALHHIDVGLNPHDMRECVRHLSQDLIRRSIAIEKRQETRPARGSKL
jgi:flagellar biosynthesis/type III secretory pathway protein FliH